VSGGSSLVTRRLSYAQLDERANRVAHYLSGLGIGPGDHVAVCLTNGPEFLEVTLGVFKLRAVPVNANFRYTAEELRALFDDAEVRAVVTQDGLAERVTEAAPHLPALRLGQEYEAALAAASGSRPEVPDRSGDDLYLLFTGGTTGMPKGVMWRHEDLFFGALGGTGVARHGQPQLDDPERIGDFVRHGTGITRRLPLCPLIHGAAQWTALGALLTGGTCLLSVDTSFSAASALRFAADERAELLMVIGDAVTRPLAEELARHPDDYDLSELKLISSSGAILSPAVVASICEHLPDLRIIDRFGASETGGQGRIGRGRDGTGPLTLHSDGHTHVLDEDLRPIEAGSGRRGRLARSGWIPLGYWKDEAKTAATFPTVDGVRYSVPGDLATIEEDGSITVFGRGSTVINTGGEKVFPEEVEATLKSHPAISDALVVGTPHPRFGQQVSAVVSLRAGTVAPSAAEIAAHCRTHLAGYKVPRHVAVVDAVSRTVTGKGDYTWAREIATAEAG
jgi:3-oxocholest-4-en-26-oate---CoA ligase